ncbi:MAG: cation transporter [Candidatus Krumholzibacteriota bacterium]|nr:cation transporter [Candidatus Krumholzibacteriota bacterium]
MGGHEHHSHSPIKSGRSITLAGMGVNAVLIALKILGARYGQSRALLADGIHSLTDLISDILVLISLYFFGKEKDQDHPYGHGKIETLTTIGVGVLLFLAAARIGIDAVVALYRGEITTPHRFTIIIAAISVISKEVLYQVTVRHGKKIKSEAMIANAWHHRSDAWSSVATLIGVSLAVFVPSLRVLDLYAALLVSFFIIKMTFEILSLAIKKIIDTSPSPEFIQKVAGEVLKVPGVLECHDIMARYYAYLIRMELHIEVDPHMTVEDAHAIIDKVVEALTTRFEDIDKVLIHVDPHRVKTGEE